MVVTVERTQIIEVLANVSVPASHDENCRVVYIPYNQQSEPIRKVVSIIVGVSTIPHSSWKDEWGFRYRHTQEDPGPVPFYTYMMRTREDYELWLASDRVTRKDFMRSMDNYVHAHREHVDREFYIPVLNIDLEDDIMTRLKVGARILKIAAPVYPTSNVTMLSRNNGPYGFLPIESATIPLHLVIFKAIGYARRSDYTSPWRTWRNSKMAQYNLEGAVKARGGTV